MKKCLNSASDVVLHLFEYGVRDAVLYFDEGSDEITSFGHRPSRVLVRCHPIDVRLAEFALNRAWMPLGWDFKVRKLWPWQRPYKIEIRYK